MAKCYVQTSYSGGRAGLRLCVPSLGDVEMSNGENYIICCSSIRKLKNYLNLISIN
jgi:hypothetical protein